MKTFILVAAALVPILFYTSCATGYYNDGSAVYYKHWNEGSGAQQDRLKADPKTFRVLKFDRYAKDKQHVFYNGSLIKEADAASFEAIGSFYARDKNSGYYGGDKVKQSVGAGFSIIDDYYSTDGKDVFYTTDALGVANPKQFRFVYKEENQETERWATDGQYYYFKSYKVPSDDYAHMTLYRNSGGLSKDSKWVYFRDHKLNYNLEGKKVVDTIDVASFTVSGYLKCRDKDGCFNVFHGREACK